MKKQIFQIKYVSIKKLQAHNQEFFRIRDVSWNGGTSINTLLKEQERFTKEKFHKKKFEVFSLKCSYICFSNDSFSLQMHTIRVFVSVTMALFSIFRKKKARPRLDLQEVFFKNSCHAKRCTALSLFCYCDLNLWKIPTKEPVFNKVATSNFIYLTA